MDKELIKDIKDSFEVFRQIVMCHAQNYPSPGHTGILNTIDNIIIRIEHAESENEI